MKGFRRGGSSNSRVVRQGAGFWLCLLVWGPFSGWLRVWFRGLGLREAGPQRGMNFRGRNLW